MAPDQMGMSAPAISPDQLAVFDQMRQQVSPKEFSDEVLAGASQIDPQAVAEFIKELQSAEITPEELEELNNVVDEILANPEQYEEIRQRYISQGLEEDLLPEKFDPFFFAALNMAVDQLIAAPAGPQAFAKGGIAELKPIAKALADYGRNGDTMLAHITPAEARMLRRRGGSGTINPHTGLPEFFRRAFRRIARAVKKFASSTVGRVVTTVALGFFLGPAAASALGATSAAGVAAVSGFVGSAGSTLAAGGNLRDALKAGAVGGLTAGAGAAIAGGAGAFQAGSASTAGLTPGQALQSQVDKFTGGVRNLVGGAAPTPAAAPGAAPAPVPGADQAAAAAPGAAPVPAPAGAVDATAAPGSLAKAAPSSPSLFDSTKDFIKRNISPSGIRAAGAENALSTVQQQFPGVTAQQIMNAPASSVLGKAYQAAMPGVLSTYGPAIATGLGVTALAGGFDAKQPELSPTARELLDRDKNRPKIEDRPDLFYIQGLPGVKYDEKGRIIGSTPWQPSATMDDVRVPAAGMSGIGSISPPMYTPDAGSIGGGQGVSQPYNTSSMYNNIMRPPPMLQTPSPDLVRKFGSGPSPMPGLTPLPYPADLFSGYGGGSGSGTPGFAEGGEVEDVEYLMHGGMPHGGQQMAGLASLAQGGYPRRTGQISGPGTETSDSIPAMLSDGEFVMTAKAVKGLGNGSRRAGAKKMYALMHQLERNASRG